MKKRNIIAIIAAVLIIAFTAADLKLALKPAAQLFTGEISFREYTQQVSDAYVSGTAGKYQFVNLNGLYCKLTGRNICNLIMRLENGMLTDLDPERMDESAPAAGITELAQFTRSLGAEFLYVQLPAKMDLGGELLIPGEADHSNENADEMLARLTAAGVETADFRQFLAQTPQQIEKYFFRTDHHWNFTGAFEAYRELTEELERRFPDCGIDPALADMANWEAHTLKNWMLGSQGKRTGLYFGGTDDITYYTPRFETEMSCTIPEYSGGSASYEGSFEQTVIRSEYLDERPDWFTSSPYDMYIGGEYALVQHRNPDAPGDLKICIIKDSFTLPVQAFLSAQFKYIDVLDPRRMDDFTAAEYIQETEPDIVIVMLSTNTAGAYPEYSDYGVQALTK